MLNDNERREKPQCYALPIGDPQHALQILREVAGLPPTRDTHD